MPTTSDRHPASTLRSCVGFSPLASNGQATTVSCSSVAADVDEPSDIHVYFTTEITFDSLLAIDDLSDAREIHLSELSHTGVTRHTGLVHNILGLIGPNAVDVLQRDLNALVVWNIYAGNYGHTVPPFRQYSASIPIIPAFFLSVATLSRCAEADLALPLFVPEIFTHYHHAPLAPDNPALGAPLLHGC